MRWLEDVSTPSKDHCSRAQGATSRLTLLEETGTASKKTAVGEGSGVRGGDDGHRKREDPIPGLNGAERLGKRK